jgi:hypothetical protein
MAQPFFLSSFPEFAQQTIGESMGAATWDGSPYNRCAIRAMTEKEK